MKRAPIIAILLASYGPAFGSDAEAPARAFTNLPMNSASIRALNKQTGRTKDISVPVGGNQIFDTVLVDVKACYARPEDEAPENSAFVVVAESNTAFKEELRSVRRGDTIFSGWIFSSSPSLSAIEHPNYDIWLLECLNDPRLPKIEPPAPPAEP